MRLSIAANAAEGAGTQRRPVNIPALSLIHNSKSVILKYCSLTAHAAKHRSQASLVSPRITLTASPLVSLSNAKHVCLKLIVAAQCVHLRSTKASLMWEMSFLVHAAAQCVHSRRTKATPIWCHCGRGFSSTIVAAGAFTASLMPDQSNEFCCPYTVPSAQPYESKSAQRMPCSSNSLQVYLQECGSTGMR